MQINPLQSNGLFHSFTTIHEPFKVHVGLQQTDRQTDRQTYQLPEQALQHLQRLIHTDSAVYTLVLMTDDTDSKQQVK